MTWTDLGLIIGAALIGFGLRDAYTLLFTWWVLRIPSDVNPLPETPLDEVVSGHVKVVDQ